ncbi:cysteine hydrolase family protein [Peribacillus simplex]|uniref:Cysteine hydrolase n=1 Tax=Peribacillus simplex TaxID=1478 RepID=A0AAW7IGI0_9BACI|nr:cysteine hydrolase [Peribacillus simplex]MDM5450977.1 cysteine hydrolase [Peribacillus simplex]
MTLNIDFSKTAVLSLHMQNDIVLQEGKLGGFFGEQVEAGKVIEYGKQLIENARSSKIPVIHVCVQFNPDYSDLIANSALLTMVKQVKALEKGKWGGDIVSELHPLKDETVISHQRVGPFYGTELSHILKKGGFDSIILFGVATNVIVETTARVLSDEGYNVFIVEDCCSAATLEAHQASLGSLSMLSKIVTVNEIFK